jgi:hypothetical protein
MGSFARVGLERSAVPQGSGAKRKRHCVTRFRNGPEWTRVVGRAQHECSDGEAGLRTSESAHSYVTVCRHAPSVLQSPLLAAVPPVLPQHHPKGVGTYSDLHPQYGTVLCPIRPLPASSQLAGLSAPTLARSLLLPIGQCCQLANSRSGNGDPSSSRWFLHRNRTERSARRLTIGQVFN